MENKVKGLGKVIATGILGIAALASSGCGARHWTELDYKGPEIKVGFGGSDSFYSKNENPAVRKEDGYARQNGPPYPKNTKKVVEETVNPSFESGYEASR